MSNPARDLSLALDFFYQGRVFIEHAIDYDTMPEAVDDVLNCNLADIIDACDVIEEVLQSLFTQVEVDGVPPFVPDHPRDDGNVTA